MNPLAQPATILGRNPAIDAYKGYVDKVLEDVEKKKQLEALKKQGIDKALLPPDIDVQGTFAPELNEITKNLDDYSNYKADLATKGVDITSPQYQNEFYKGENAIKNKAILSKQHQASYANTITELSKAKADESYDIEATKQRLAEFVAASEKGGVMGGEDYIKKNGSLLVPKAFDEYKYGSEVAARYKTTTTSSDPKSVGGQRVITTVEEVTPENRLGAGADYLSNPQARQKTEVLYTALSPQKQAEYEQKALLAGGQQGDGLKMFASDRIAPFWKEGVTKKGVNIPTGGSGNKTETPTTNITIDGLVAALRGDSNVIQVDSNGLKTYSGLDGVPIGTFEKRVMVATDIPDPKDPTGKTPIYEEEAKTVPVLIEKIFQDQNGKWHYVTNETIANRKGKVVNGVSNALPMTEAEAQSILGRATVGSGELTQKDFNTYLNKKGYLNESGILTVGTSSANDKDIFFEGQTFVVPRSSIDKSKGFPIATLPDGRKVKWEDASQTWVEYKAQTTGAKTTSKGKVR